MGDDKIIGKAIILKKLKKSYFAEYLSKFSQVVADLLHTNVHEEELYIHDRLEKVQQEKTLFYCIFLKVSDELIGAIEIREPNQYRGQLYCWLHPKFWSKGYFQEAMDLIHPLYFEQSGTKTISARVDQRNIRSYRALKKTGFANVGYVKGPFGLQHAMILRKKNIKK